MNQKLTRMKNENEEIQKIPLTVEELVPSGDDGPMKKRLIEYDVFPLRKIIEVGGIDHLIDSLRMLHTDIMEASLASFEKGEKGIFDNAPDLVENLFIIRELANCFDEIKMSAYQMKDWPIKDVKAENIKSRMN